MIVLNGELKERETVNLDSGFYFGRGLFETMLVKGKPLFLNEHLDRLNKGFTSIGIERKVSTGEVMDAVKKLQCYDKVLKLTVTEENVLFTSRENRYTSEYYKRGFSATISSVRRNATSPLTYLKSLNYLDNILEHERCRRDGFDEVLFLNGEGSLTEGSLSNIFFIKSGSIYTPSISCGLLNGIVRSFVIKRFDVIEGRFSIHDLQTADSAFLTNSVIGIMKLTSFDGTCFGESDKVREIYDAYIEECKSQAVSV